MVVFVEAVLVCPVTLALFGTPAVTLTPTVPKRPWEGYLADDHA